jgi:tripartite-type tricarboxylate transporter receptor subunit TctC
VKRSVILEIPVRFDPGLFVPLKNFAGALVAALLCSPLAFAQSWPTKPIRWISPWPAGGANDVFSRALAQKLTESLGQPVVVDNKAGAAGTIGSDLAAKSPGDGYTIVMGSSPTHAIAPSVYANLPYDPIRDFVPVTLVAVVPNVLIVHPSVPAKSVAELIAYAKANPGKINFASTGNGTSQHLSAELFKTMTGIDIVHVPYKGTAPALTELLSGTVQMAFENMPVLLPHIQAGKLRALAVTPAKRSAVLPDLPTVAEAGVPGYEAAVWFGVLVPAKTPRPIVDKLHEEIMKALETPNLKMRMASLGAEVVGLGPDQFASYLSQEIPKWAKVVKAAGVTPQ